METKIRYVPLDSLHSPSVGETFNNLNQEQMLSILWKNINNMKSNGVQMYKVDPFNTEEEKPDEDSLCMYYIMRIINWVESFNSYTFFVTGDFMIKQPKRLKIANTKRCKKIINEEQISVPNFYSFRYKTKESVIYYKSEADKIIEYFMGIDNMMEVGEWLLKKDKLK